MKLEECYSFSPEEIVAILDSTEKASAVVGLGKVLGMLNTIEAGGERGVDLVEKVNSLVDQYGVDGVMEGAFVPGKTTSGGSRALFFPVQRETPPVWDTRRPCLVGNHKHWFHRWQTRKWVCDPSPLRGGGPGGQCEVTMAIVEDQETGQVSEVYPREVRFIS